MREFQQGWVGVFRVPSAGGCDTFATHHVIRLWVSEAERFPINTRKKLPKDILILRMPENLCALHRYLQ